MAKVLKLKENSLSEKNESVKNWSRSINWLTLVLRPVWWSEPGKDSTFSIKTNALGRTFLNVGPSGHPTHDLLNGCKINQNHQNSWVFRQWVETTKINAVIQVYEEQIASRKESFCVFWFSMSEISANSSEYSYQTVFLKSKNLFFLPGEINKRLWPWKASKDETWVRKSVNDNNWPWN